MSTARERIHFDKFNVLIVPPGYQVLRTYPIKDNRTFRFSITVVARQTDGTNRAMFTRTGLFFRQAGGPVQIQGPTWHATETSKSDDTMDIKFILGATDLVVQVRNAGSVSTKWGGYVDKLEVK